MKKSSIDAPLLALSGVILLAGGMFIMSSVRQIGSIYQTISQEAPAASQLAQVGGGSSANDITGWAWSSNIGWISFNGANPTAGGGSYKVTVSTTTANPTLAKFSGYAWSSNVGWISFNATDVTGCPADAGVTPLDGCNAAMNLTSGIVTGYARVISMKNESGGGWLQLSGTNHPSGSTGVTFDSGSGDITGFAWEPSAVGWVEFKAELGTTAIVPTPSFAVACTANPASVSPGGTVTFTANVTGNQGPNTYTYTWGEGSCGNSPTCEVTYPTAGTQSGPTLAVKASNLPETKNGFCQNIAVSSVSSGTNLFIGPNVSTTKTSHSLRQGNIFALKWTAAPTDYESCTLRIDNGGEGYWGSAVQAVSDSGAQAGNIAGLLTAVSSGVQRGNYTFTRTCYDTEALLPPQPSTATLRIVGASGEEF